MNQTRCTLALVCGIAVVAIVAPSGYDQHAVATSQKSEESNASSAASAKSNPAPAQPRETSAPRVTTQPARIDPYERTPLFSKIEGYVRKSRHVTGAEGEPVEKPIADIGERVREHDVLAELWVPELHEELRQKEALVAQAQAQSEQAAQAVVVAERAKDKAQAYVSEVEAGVVRAAGEFERWESEKTRLQQLATRGSVTQKLADETLNQFRAADAAKREAEARVQSANAALSEADADIAMAKADQATAATHVLVAEADLLRTKALLDYTKIRAPFAGVVTVRNIDTGHFVRPPQADARPLFVVERIDTLRVVVDVPELEAPLVKIGNPAFLRVQALGADETEAKVARTSWVLDATTRTLRVEIDLPNTDNRRRPGMYATARIVLD